MGRRRGEVKERRGERGLAVLARVSRSWTQSCTINSLTQSRVSSSSVSHRPASGLDEKADRMQSGSNSTNGQISIAVYTVPLSCTREYENGRRIWDSLDHALASIKFAIRSLRTDLSSRSVVTFLTRSPERV